VEKSPLIDRRRGKWRDTDGEETKRWSGAARRVAMVGDYCLSIVCVSHVYVISRVSITCTDTQCMYIYIMCTCIYEYILHVYIYDTCTYTYECVYVYACIHMYICIKPQTHQGECVCSLATECELQETQRKDVDCIFLQSSQSSHAARIERRQE